MTRRPTRPESVLQAIVDIGQQLLHQWGSYEAVEAALANPTLRAAGEPGRSTDTPDPTHAIVVSMQRYAESCAELDEALGHLRAVQRRFQLTRQHHPAIALEADALAKALRCDGSWDPTCTRNAVRNGRCWACIKAEQRANERTEEAS